ncbi:hypothetical protein LINPERHAP1_LOCUS4676 [Linum perenne]
MQDRLGVYLTKSIILRVTYVGRNIKENVDFFIWSVSAVVNMDIYSGSVQIVEVKVELTQSRQLWEVELRQRTNLVSNLTVTTKVEPLELEGNQGPWLCTMTCQMQIIGMDHVRIFKSL